MAVDLVRRFRGLRVLERCTEVLSYAILRA